MLTSKDNQGWLTTSTHDDSHLFFPVVVQKLISLIDDGVANTVEREQVGTTHEVQEATRSSDENVTALAKLDHLLTHRTTTVSNARTKHRAIAETTSFVEDLAAELTSRSDDENERLSSNTLSASIEVSGDKRTRSGDLLSLAHQLGDDGNQIRSGLARA
jgi:hypothetical protein